VAASRRLRPLRRLEHGARPFAAGERYAALAREYGVTKAAIRLSSAASEGRVEVVKREDDPLQPLGEVEPAILRALSDPVALVGVVQSRPRRPKTVALAAVFAIGRQAGLRAAQVQAAVEALRAGTPHPAVERLREAGVLDAVTVLVYQAHHDR
jgi:hypothetical protein